MRSCIVLIVMIFLLGACSSSLKKIQYLSSKRDMSVDYVQTSDYALKPGDNVFIQIVGNNPMVVSNVNRNDNSMFSRESINLFSHTIDSNGEITLPLLGSMKIAGMTVEAAKKAIVAKATELYRSPSIIVKLVDKAVTVLGEVNRPGKYVIYDDNLNIFEALGLAGDLNDYANRKNIKLIREVNGQEKVINIDITDSNIINSEYYKIFPGDVLYASPRNRVYGTKTLSFTGIFGTSLSVISTIISVILLVR